MASFCGEKYLRLCDDVAAHAAACGRSPGDIAIVAVTKAHPLDVIPQLYAAGCRDFGESRVQEFLPKKDAFTEPCRWHFIGSLQKNKASKIIGQCSLIHSVDSAELAEKISSLSVQSGCQTAVLLEVNTSGEASKHGFNKEELSLLFESLAFLPGIAIHGLMTMAPQGAPKAITAACFSCLRNLRDILAKSYSVPLPILSMGMSGDYTIAIEEGSTLLRIGSALF